MKCRLWLDRCVGGRGGVQTIAWTQFFLLVLYLDSGG